MKSRKLQEKEDQLKAWVEYGLRLPCIVIYDAHTGTMTQERRAVSLGEVQGAKRLIMVPGYDQGLRNEMSLWRLRPNVWAVTLQTFDEPPRIPKEVIAEIRRDFSEGRENVPLGVHLIRPRRESRRWDLTSQHALETSRHVWGELPVWDEIYPESGPWPPRRVHLEVYSQRNLRFGSSGLNRYGFWDFAAKAEVFALNPLEELYYLATR